MTRRVSVLGLVLLALALSATNATASTPMPATPQTAAQLPSTVVLFVSNSKVSASDVATGKVTFLADVKMKKGTKRNSPRCHWVTGGWNSGHTAGGGLRWFWDGVRAKICPNAKSPTGWVKVAGGKTGRACFNPWSTGKPPGPVVKGDVVMLRTFANMPMKLTAYAKVRATGVCGWAEAKSTATLRASLRSYVKGKGAKAVRMYGKLVASLTAKASAQVHCEVVAVTIVLPSCTVECVPPPPPPPSCVPTTTGCKDGTSGLPAPVSNPAPGPNPQPSAQDPAPGGHKCFWESAGTGPTGLPHGSGDEVLPAEMGPNGACPVGATDGT